MADKSLDCSSDSSGARVSCAVFVESCSELTCIEFNLSQHVMDKSHSVLNPQATSGTTRCKRSPPTESETAPPPSLRSPPTEFETTPTIKKDDFPSPVQTNNLQDSSTQDIADESANGVDPVDLSARTSVVYEERSSVPGVRFVNSKGQEEWSPVVKRTEKKVKVTKGGGNRNNPVRDGDDVEPRLSFVKDIRFMEL